MSEQRQRGRGRVHTGLTPLQVYAATVQHPLRSDRQWAEQFGMTREWFCKMRNRGFRVAEALRHQAEALGLPSALPPPPSPPAPPADPSPEAMAVYRRAGLKLRNARTVAAWVEGRLTTNEIAARERVTPDGIRMRMRRLRVVLARAGVELPKRRRPKPKPLART